MFVTCSSIFALEQIAFSTGQDGAIRSVGEELKTNLEFLIIGTLCGKLLSFSCDLLLLSITF